MCRGARQCVSSFCRRRVSPFEAVIARPDSHWYELEVENLRLKLRLKTNWTGR